MKFRLAVRIALLGLAIAGVAAVWWNPAQRRAAEGGASASELLDAGIARRSTDFEHAEFKLGKRVFQVRSTTDTLTALGEHRLRDVQLTVYGEDGEPSDWISGETARYEVEKKWIEFSGKVQVRLADGTLLYSDRLQADLAAQTVAIDEEFRFERGEARGKGGGLLYRIPDKVLEIERRFSMVSSGDDPFEAGAERALYELAGLRLNLLGDARLSGSNYRLVGNEMAVGLTPERRVESVLDSGQARFVSDGKTFAGQQIRLAFDPRSSRLTRFEVLGEEAGAASPVRAVYEERVRDGFHRLLADRISGVPSADSRDPGRVQLETFRAERDVVFLSPALGVDQASASLLDGSFDGQGRLRQLRMSGGVTVNRSEGRRRDRLRSRRLQLDFDQSQRLEKGIAYEQAEVASTLPGLTRRHFAESSIVVDFNQGRIARITGSGGCRTETVDEQGRSEVLSPSLLALYSDGVIDRVFAGDGVTVLLQQGEQRQRTESLQLRLEYKNGVLSQAVQTGNFRYEEKSPDYQVELEAERAVFSPDKNSARLSGEREQPRLKQIFPEQDGTQTVSVTRADRFEVERGSGRLAAFGQVVSRIQEADRPLLVKAGEMTVDPGTGWVQYSQSPRVEQGDSFISGKTVRLHSRDRTLVAEPEADSFLSSGEGDKLKRYRISADRVTVMRSDNKAFYEGKVWARADDFAMKAPFLELRFEGDGLDSLREAEAWGGVQVEDPTRRASGDRAFYEPLEKRVQVVGDKAQVTDSKQGKATGRALTFYLGDERIFIEGPVKRQP